jgi:hypothetical protein
MVADPALIRSMGWIGDFIGVARHLASTQGAVHVTGHLPEYSRNLLLHALAHYG